MFVILQKHCLFYKLYFQKMAIYVFFSVQDNQIHLSFYYETKLFIQGINIMKLLLLKFIIQFIFSDEYA